MIKTYQVIEEGHPYNGRMATKIGNQTILLANFTQKQEFIFNSTLESLVKSGKATEIDLEKQYWMHPHLYKPIKKEVYSKYEKQ